MRVCECATMQACVRLHASVHECVRLSTSACARARALMHAAMGLPAREVDQSYAIAAHALTVLDMHEDTAACTIIVCSPIPERKVPVKKASCPCTRPCTHACTHVHAQQHVPSLG